MKKLIKLEWEEFVKKYKPKVNHFDDNASLDGYMFETYGAELEHIKER